MANRKHILVASLLFLVISGCTGSNVIRQSEIDSLNKTVFITDNSTPLATAVIAELESKGWVTTGPSDQIKEGGGQGSANTKTARYTLNMSSYWTDICFPSFQAMLEYSLVLIDNDTGKTVITMGGRDCSGYIVEKVGKALAE